MLMLPSGNGVEKFTDCSQADFDVFRRLCIKHDRPRGSRHRSTRPIFCAHLDNLIALSHGDIVRQAHLAGPIHPWPEVQGR